MKKVIFATLLLSISPVSALAGQTALSTESGERIQVLPAVASPLFEDKTPHVLALIKEKKQKITTFENLFQKIETKLFSAKKEAELADEQSRRSWQMLILSLNKQQANILKDIKNLESELTILKRLLKKGTTSAYLLADHAEKIKERLLELGNTKAPNLFSNSDVIFGKSFEKAATPSLEQTEQEISKLQFEKKLVGKLLGEHAYKTDISSSRDAKKIFRNPANFFEELSNSNASGAH